MHFHCDVVLMANPTQKLSDSIDCIVLMAAVRLCGQSTVLWQRHWAHRGPSAQQCLFFNETDIWTGPCKMYSYFSRARVRTELFQFVTTQFLRVRAHAALLCSWFFFITRSIHATLLFLPRFCLCIYISPERKRAKKKHTLFSSCFFIFIPFVHSLFGHLCIECCCLAQSAYNIFKIDECKWACRRW